MRTPVKFARFFAVVIIFGALALAALITFWFVLGGRERVRAGIVSQLQPVFGDSFDIKEISLYPHSIVLHEVIYDPTPTLHVNVSVVSIRISPYALLSRRSSWQGAIEEIELHNPRLTVSPSSHDSLEANPGFKYVPYSLKKLSILKIIKRIRVIDGSISHFGFDRFLIDDLTGQIDLIEPTQSTLTLTADIPLLKDCSIKIDGRGDVTTGDFYSLLGLKIARLEDVDFRTVDKLEIGKGSMELQMEVWGGEDLKFAGLIRGDSIDVVYNDLVFLKDGAISGRMFGQCLDLNGTMSINGNPVVFTLSSDDLFHLNWKGNLKSQVDLAKFTQSLPAAPSITGSVAIEGSFTGQNEIWDGTLSLKSPAIGYSSLIFKQPNIDLIVKDGKIVTKTATAQIGRGSVELSGFTDITFDAISLDCRIEQQWLSTETPSWCKIDSPRLKGSFGVTLKEGIWFGGGEGGLFDKSDSIFVEIDANIQRDELLFDIKPANLKRGSVAFRYCPFEKTSIHLTGRDPHYLLKEIVNPKYLQEIWFQYGVQLDLEGSPQDIQGNMSIDGSNPLRSIGIDWNLKKYGNEWQGDLVSTIQLPGREQINGRATVKATNDYFKLLNGKLASGNRRELLSAKGSYSFAQRNFHDIFIKGEDLPIIEFAAMFIDGIESDLKTDVDFVVESTGENLTWDGTAEIAYPDSAEYTFEASGSLSPEKFTLNRALLSSRNDDSLFFKANGAYNFRTQSFDSLIVSLTQFDLSRTFDLFAPGMRGRFGGLVNARIDLSGNLKKPSITTDIHLTSGTLYGSPGYWANFSLEGSDGKYNAGHFNLGHNISALIGGSGFADLVNKQYRFSATSHNAEVGRLVKALSGIDLTLDGNGDISINADNSDPAKQITARIDMNSGTLSHIDFRRLSAQLSLSGMNSGIPTLHFDSLSVDWGDAIGTIKGELPLTAERSINMDVALEGRLTGFLPRITDSFSNPRGSGKITLNLGGDIRRLWLKSGSLTLNQAGFKVDQIIREVRNLNADFSLDSLGYFRINRFDFRIDDTPVKISNREADIESGEQPIEIYGYNLGILMVETAEEGFWIVIPGLMEKSWGGYLALSGIYGKSAFEFRGPSSKPYAIGKATLRNAIITYPPLHGSGQPSKFGSAVLDLLQRIHWDARVASGLSCRYYREISGLGELQAWEDIKNQVGGGLLNPGLKMFIDIRIDDNPVGLSFIGSIADTLKLSGELTSSQGSVEFLDLNFQIDKVGMQFNPAMLEPTIYGTAATTIVDSSGISREVRIRVGSGGSKLPLTAAPPDRASFSDLTLTFEDDQGHSQEQIMALLGYTPEMLPGKLSGLGGELFESATPLKKWQRGFERRLERWTGLDRITVQTNVAQNFLERQFNPVGDVNPNQMGSYWNLFYGSRVTLGKYILPNLYLSYTGALASQVETYSLTRLGIQHSWDANYRLTRISNNLVLNYRYEYNELALSQANSVMIRYSWVFNLQRQLAKVWK